MWQYNHINPLPSFWMAFVGIINGVLKHHLSIRSCCGSRNKNLREPASHRNVTTNSCATTTRCWDVRPRDGYVAWRLAAPLRVDCIAFFRWRRYSIVLDARRLLPLCSLSTRRVLHSSKRTAAVVPRNVSVDVLLCFRFVSASRHLKQLSLISFILMLIQHFFRVKPLLINTFQVVSDNSMQEIKQCSCLHYSAFMLNATSVEVVRQWWFCIKLHFVVPFLISLIRRPLSNSFLWCRSSYSAADMSTLMEPGLHPISLVLAIGTWPDLTHSHTTTDAYFVLFLGSVFRYVASNLFRADSAPLLIVNKEIYGRQSETRVLLNVA